MYWDRSHIYHPQEISSSLGDKIYLYNWEYEASYVAWTEKGQKVP